MHIYVLCFLHLKCTVCFYVCFSCFFLVLFAFLLLCFVFFSHVAIQGSRQRQSTRARFQGLLVVFDCNLGTSYPCKNPKKSPTKAKNNQIKTKKKQRTLFFLYFSIFVSVLSPAIFSYIFVAVRKVPPPITSPPDTTPISTPHAPTQVSYNTVLRSL